MSSEEEIVAKGEISNETEDGIDKRFASDPEAKYRIYSILSYFFVLIVIGLPVWWYTTRVYRAALPLEEMYELDVPNKTVRENSIPLSLEYDILITIVNPDPKNLNIILSGYELSKNLGHFVSIVSPIANFTIKSQWIYLVDLGVKMMKRGDHLVLSEEQLPHIITPLEKKIFSHMSTRPCLNLVAYVSKCGSPIIIYDSQKKVNSINSFLSPRWGGITILNVDQVQCNEGMFKPSTRSIVAIFIEQLRQLLGLTSISDSSVVNLKITKANEMVDSTKRTLKSLAQLLSEINSIVISDDVALKINIAVDNSKWAEKALREGNVDEGLRFAKIAYKNSEEAFSDPSLLALLYFPDDQKYAVYIPLFLPVMIPVVMSLLTLKTWYLKKRFLKAKID